MTFTLFFVPGARVAAGLGGGVFGVCTCAGFVIVKNGKPVAFYERSLDGYPTYSYAVSYLIALGLEPESLGLRRSESEEDYLSWLEWNAQYQYVVDLDMARVLVLEPSKHALQEYLKNRERFPWHREIALKAGEFQFKEMKSADLRDYVIREMARDPGRFDPLHFYFAAFRWAFGAVW